MKEIRLRIQYIIHADFEQPGILQQWAKSHQFKESFCRPFAGEATPDPKNFDLLILMGGPQCSLKRELFPYLDHEIALVKKAIKANIPVLGFCLGAQLIGEALGAHPERSPHTEIGVFPIELTQEGLQEPVLKGIPQKFLTTHWHNDMPGLTAEAKILATSLGCPRQIIRYSPSIYGFQCLPEATKQDVESMIQHGSNNLVEGKFIQSAKQFLDHDFSTINSIMVQFMNNWLIKLG